MNVWKAFRENKANERASAAVIVYIATFHIAQWILITVA